MPRLITLKEIFQPLLESRLACRVALLLLLATSPIYFSVQDCSAYTWNSLWKRQPGPLCICAWGVCGCAWACVCVYVCVFPWPTLTPREINNHLKHPTNFFSRELPILRSKIQLQSSIILKVHSWMSKCISRKS